MAKRKKTEAEIREGRGEALQLKRREWGLTQTQLADQLDIHPISLSRFERGVETIPVMMELALYEFDRRQKGVMPQIDILSKEK